MFAPLRLCLCVVFLPAFLTCSNAQEPRKNELPAAVRAVLDKAETVELLALDPHGIEKGDDVPEKDRFHGYKILGRAVLKDANARTTVLTALDKGIQDSDGKQARCFNPRHGVRATHDGKTVDLVICFECLSMQAHAEGKLLGGALTTRSPQPVFDKALRDVIDK